jgi:hypothetical protein
MRILRTRRSRNGNNLIVIGSNAIVYNYPCLFGRRTGWVLGILWWNCCRQWNCPQHWDLDLLVNTRNKSAIYNGHDSSPQTTQGAFKLGAVRLLTVSGCLSLPRNRIRKQCHSTNTHQKSSRQRQRNTYTSMDCECSWTGRQWCFSFY